MNIVSQAVRRPNILRDVMDATSRLFTRPEKGGDPLAVANAVLDELDAIGSEAHMVRLQRLIVLAHGWSLALHGRPLIQGTIRITAGRPSVPAVHDAFRQMSWNAIGGRAAVPEMPSFDMPSDTDRMRREIIRAVVKAYAGFDGYALGKVLADLLGDAPEGSEMDHAALRNGLLRRIAPVHVTVGEPVTA